MLGHFRGMSFDMSAIEIVLLHEGTESQRQDHMDRYLESQGCSFNLSENLFLVRVGRVNLDSIGCAVGHFRNRSFKLKSCSHGDAPKMVCHVALSNCRQERTNKHEETEGREKNIASSI